MKKICCLIFAAILSLCAFDAFADSSIEVDGTVVNTNEIPILAAYAGTIGEINVSEGSRVNAGDVVAVLKTNKVYADVDGTVRLFGAVGDSAEMTVSHYGAVAYIEPNVAYTLSASTDYAYDSEETETIHPGETVYLRGTSTLTDVGTGVVTAVSGTSYNVDLLEGSFESGESAYIYRDEDYSYSQRIGRGTVNRSEYAVYEGSGIIAAYRVENGSEVKKGDVLFETVEGEFAGYDIALTEIRAAESGIISSVSTAAGGSVIAGDTLCSLYPDSAMRVEAMVSEEYLAAVSEGAAVNVRFECIDNGEYAVNGTVERVSVVGTTDEESEEAFYAAIIKLDDTTGISYGMKAVITN